MDDLEEILDLFNITEIDTNRNYWLVRTKSGKYFDEFYIDGFIGIGWNKISDMTIINSDQEAVKNIIKQGYPDENRPGLIANQIIRFVKEMKKGDIVLIPSKNSRYVAFGELVDDNIYLEDIDNAEELEIRTYLQEEKYEED